MTARGEMIMEQPSADTLKVILSGHWKLGGELPGADKVQQRLEGRPGVRNLVFDTRELAYWDSGLLTFLMNLGTFCSRQKISPEQRRTAPRGAETVGIGLGGTGKERCPPGGGAGVVSHQFGQPNRRFIPICR